MVLPDSRWYAEGSKCYGKLCKEERRAFTNRVILQGTIVNTLAVLIGASLGAFIGRRLPDRITKTTFVGIGLFTLFLGMKLSLETENPLLVLISLLLGGALGSALSLDQRLRILLNRIPGNKPSLESSDRQTGDGSNSAQRLQSSNSDLDGSGKPQPMHGVLNAFLLFCVGSMTVLGCIQEGLGKGSDLLFAKSVLDGISSIALASAFGGVILVVALPLFLFQSTLTLAAVHIAPFLEPEALANLNGVGGLLLLGLALEILELKAIKILNLLPALVLAPALTNLYGLILSAGWI